MNVGDDQDARRRALLLHYAGERVYDIYDAEKGEGAWSFKEASEVLTKYFKPKTNIQIEIFTFRSCTETGTIAGRFCNRASHPVQKLWFWECRS